MMCAPAKLLLDKQVKVIERRTVSTPEVRQKGRDVALVC
jgi:hypothetical protein